MRFILDDGTFIPVLLDSSKVEAILSAYGAFQKEATEKVDLVFSE